MQKTLTAKIDAAGLRAVGASQVLALDPSVLGANVAMPESAPSADVESAPVAVVEMAGPLAQRAQEGLCAYVDGYDAVSARFEAGLAAAETGVLLVIDSPGGDVAGLEAAVDRMRAAKAASGKRVVVYVDEMAASAAYWIAAALGDEIVAPQSARVGSIGCIGAVVDESEAERMAGREWVVHREPAGKADGMAVAPVRGLAEERLAASVKSCALRFYDAVAAFRPSLTAKDAAGLNGAVLDGRAAKRAGLIDRVGTMETALALASKKPGKPRQEKRQMKTLLGALGLSLDAHDHEIEAAGLQTIDGLKVQIESAAGQVERLTAELAEARAKLAAVESAEAERVKAAEADERASLIAEAVEAGKLAPAKRDELAAKAEQHGTEWLRALVDTMPAIVRAAAPIPAVVEPHAETDERVLSADTIARAKAAGIDPNRVAETLGAILKR